MKVSELIEFLQKQPQDIEVIFRQYSEYAILDVEDITLKTPSDKYPVAYRRQQGYYESIHHYPQDETGELCTVLVFPGN